MRSTFSASMKRYEVSGQEGGVVGGGQDRREGAQQLQSISQSVVREKAGYVRADGGGQARLGRFGAWLAWAGLGLAGKKAGSSRLQCRKRAGHARQRRAGPKHPSTQAPRQVRYLAATVRLRVASRSQL